MTADEQNTLFEDNQGLVYSFLKQREIYLDGLEWEDLCQEGFLALWEACQKFDPSKGKFSTLAWRVLNNHYTDLIRKDSRCIHAIPVEPSKIQEQEEQS